MPDKRKPKMSKKTTSKKRGKQSPAYLQNMDIEIADEFGFELDLTSKANVMGKQKQVKTPKKKSRKPN